MTIETIFVTQVASIVAFIISLFVLYRLLVQKKDATIELLKEQISFSKERLAAAECQDPDILVERLTKRAQALEGELEHLQGEQLADKEQLSLLEQKLEKARQEVVEVEPKLVRAQSVFRRYAMQQKTRLAMIEMYGGKCQVCDSGTHETAKLAHIRPISADGASDLSNILCLCANHHILFDLGYFSIASDCSLLGIDGRLVVKPDHHISQESLNFHRDNIYQPNKAIDSDEG